MNPDLMQGLGTAVFAVALLHTFSTSFFQRLAHGPSRHAGLWHLLGEVEVVFGFWAMVLMVGMFAIQGRDAATHYLDSRDFNEPLFVFVIMVVAGSRPVLFGAGRLVALAARVLPLRDALSYPLVALTLVPLLGSFITEPAAMTLAALLLRERLFQSSAPRRLRYAALAVLFVNISIGGTLTPYAAPPILMVAGAWGWDLSHMLLHFGDKAALAVLINAVGLLVLMRRDIPEISAPGPAQAASDLADAPGAPVPWSVVGAHLAFLSGIVVFAHHPPVFLGLFLFFLGFSAAYERHQDRLILREALLVAFFLAGLVVLGGLQQWWLEPLLLRLSTDAVFVAATALTAITDNAALTYLGSLVDGLSPDFQYALVAGAVTGGGLTLIANAPNPAGAAILKAGFEDESISALRLFVAALWPTAVAFALFKWL
jgi:hypothetical protein